MMRLDYGAEHLGTILSSITNTTTGRMRIFDLTLTQNFCIS